jgi:hypothetical protein
MVAMGARLTQAVIEIEQHVAAGGWDQPARLYALVETARLVEEEPQLAEQIDPVAATTPGHLTPVEQEELPAYQTVEELLAGIAWPPEVSGAALVIERVMLPPDVEEAMPEDEGEAVQWAATHPQRQEVRLVAGVARDGSRDCAVRFRSQDRDDAVLSGPELVPGLPDALAATLVD